MTAPYLAAVDSGGTHTNIQIRTPEGTTTNVPEIARSLSSNRSDEELQKTCDDIFSAIRTRTGDGAFVWISSAGYSLPTQARFERIVKASMYDSVTVGMANDAVSLLLAHDPEIVVVVAGTGSVAMARTEQDEVITRGGDEWVVADYGSAFWIGLEGIRAAYRAVEGGDETALKSNLSEAFSGLAGGSKTDDEAAIVRMIGRALASEGTDTKRTIASFAPKVTQRAESGDEVARDIVFRAAEELADSAARVYRQVADSPELVPQFVISGSVAHYSPFYAETFKAAVNRLLYDVRDEQGDLAVIRLQVQLNGMHESMELATRLSEGTPLPPLDRDHPHSLLS